MVPGAPSSAYKAKDEDVHRKAVFCSHHGRKVSPNKAKKGGEADGGDGRKRAIRGATSCSKVSDRLLLQPEHKLAMASPADKYRKWLSSLCKD